MKFSKIGYAVSRQVGIFSLPALNKIRNFFYARHFNTSDIHVDDFVRIGPAHRTTVSSLKIGPGLRVGRMAELDSSGGLEIGERVTISEGAKIYTHDHVVDGGGFDWRPNPLKTSRLKICRDAWVGAGAVILPSVSYIGAGAVIGSGSVVRANVGDLEIVAGNPAKLIRKRKLDESKI